MSKKNSSLSISPKLLQNNREAYFSNIWLTLWRKKGFINIYPLLLIWSKKNFKQIQIFLRIFSFSNMVRKTYFLSISVLVSEIVILCLKRTVFYEFLQKCFKTTERHSLAICGLHCGEKQFLLIFIRLDWFDQKHLLKQIQIFLRIYPFSNMVRKRNSLSISGLVSEIVILCLEIKVLYEFHQKCLKTTERHSLEICGLLCG